MALAAIDPDDEDIAVGQRGGSGLLLGARFRGVEHQFRTAHPAEGRESGQEQKAEGNESGQASHEVDSLLQGVF
jgi:hypothetical protein